MGTAYCLQHTLELKPPIVLGQLQSKSILLTDDYAAKVHATLSCLFLCNFLPSTGIRAHPIHVSTKNTLEGEGGGTCNVGNV